MTEKMPRLVIVDDDPAIVRIVERIVSQHLPRLFEIATFTDPVAARDWINDNQCDVLISDVQMPRIGGPELIVAGKRRNDGMQTIFLTAHSSWERVAEAIEQGVNDYLLKPVDQAELIGLLRQKHRSLTRPPTAPFESVNGHEHRTAPVPIA